MKDMLLGENEVSIVVKFAYGVVGQVKFLKVFEVLEDCDTVELFDVVFVENQLTEVLV